MSLVAHQDKYIGFLETAVIALILCNALAMTVAAGVILWARGKRIADTRPLQVRRVG